MRLGDWSEYTTPDDVAAELVCRVNGIHPRHVVDICAGRGSLLSAASARWSQAKLYANDILPTLEGKHFDSICTMDGRLFALQEFSAGRTYNLVIANPPFGATFPFSTTPWPHSLDSETLGLLGSQRIEQSMTIAAALLVADHGVLASIVPDTIVNGASYTPLRRWMSKRFKSFTVVSLTRGEFRNQDLGLALLIASKSVREEALDPLAFTGSSHPPRDVEGISINRGRLISAQTCSRGGVQVVHAGGANSPGGVELRRCRKSEILGTKEQIWVTRGDVVVTRVGRSAGSASIVDLQKPAILTDCVYRLRTSTLQAKVRLRRLVESGRLSSVLRKRAQGLGAKFIRRSDLTAALRTLLK